MIDYQMTAAAFGAGLLTSVSPCVFPMIPITLSFLGTQAKSGTRIQLLLFFMGQVLTFVVLGIAAVQLGEVFGFSSQSKPFQMVTGGFLVTFGLSSYFNYVPTFLQRLSQFSQNRSNSLNHKLLAPVIFGVSAALMASPCSSPILGSVLITLSDSESFYTGLFSMASFALGSSLLMLVIGFGFLNARALPRSGPWLTRVHRISAVLMLAVGIYYFGKAFGLLSFMS